MEGGTGRKEPRPVKLQSHHSPPHPHPVHGHRLLLHLAGCAQLSLPFAYVLFILKLALRWTPVSLQLACPQAQQGLGRPAGVSVAVGSQDDSRQEEEEVGTGDLVVS